MNTANVRFQWDDHKAALNLRKHGVDFEDAKLVFADPFAITRQDRTEGGELRWQTLGCVGEHMLLLVAHTCWDDEDGEVIRIISARRADRREKRSYYDGNRD
ncbi:MAG: BrnT family toxin [Azoarcus sp.]|jgi:uncharacterized DUF497 family protein|nr:BrnT family toxin [Azoarcus sp.]